MKELVNLKEVFFAKEELRKSLATIESQEERRKASREASEKLIEKYGTESEKYGMKFCLYPMWSMII